jgi:hypothetical protein
MHTTGITDQIRRAAQRQNRIAAIVGCVLGAFVPLATYRLAHAEATIETVRGQVALALVLAGLAYSATTVYGWARIAFRVLPKAIGFVVLLEGTMTLASTWWLALAALAILTTINALATACNLADDQRETRAAAKVTKPKPADVLHVATLPRVVTKQRKPLAAKTVRTKAGGRR